MNPGARLGPYEILAPLGAGGMGQVYKARDTRLDRIVAIKTLSPAVIADPASHERFDREARAISQLNHPHICTLHDVGTADGAPYLVLEYLEGQTLAERLTSSALPLDQALTIGGQICDALARAHRSGIVHRDLKPANVMLTKSGAKLLDFGLAKPAAPPVALNVSVGAVTVSTPLTTEGTLLGTLQYMSPEQIEGKDADARSDIFAVGAVLHEMVSGARAFDGKSAASVIAAILERQPPLLSTLQALSPPALDHIVTRCLAKDPEERWQSAADVMRELKWVRESAAAPRPGTTRSRWTGKRLLAVAAVVVALALGGLIIRQQLTAPSTSASPQFPIQFTVDPPADSGWNPGYPISISPDGRHLAFVARLPQSIEAGLWIRSFDQLEARFLPGTERAQTPFWSPDGRFIGFFVRGQLRKVAADGGAVQTICAVDGGRGGTWNRDDVLVFASSEALFRVSASGGLPVELRRGVFEWPVFLPDGRHFLYVERTPGAGPRRLRAATLDDAAGRDLAQAPSNVAYASSGHLLFARGQGDERAGRTLVAQPFDLTRLALSGEPQILAQDIAFNALGARAVFSVSANGTLAYRRNPLRDTKLAWFDREGRALGAVGPPGAIFAPALSPDGQTVAFVRLDPSSGTPDIWLMDVARGVPTRFTFDAGPTAAPTWSPDGTQVLFATRTRRLVAKPVRGGTERVLAELADLQGVAYANDWSADGQHVLFDTRGASADTWRLPLTGDQRPIPVSNAPEFHERHQRLSPDGRWIAYESDEAGQADVFIRPFAGLGRAERISAAGGGWPQWRRDGRELYYLAPDGQIMVTQIEPGAVLKASVPRRLFAVNAVQTDRYAVTADGQRFLMVTDVNDDSLGVTVVVNWPATIVK